MAEELAARRRWRRIYFLTVLYGVATLAALWAFARAYTF
jgi:hypothetical protein